MRIRFMLAIALLGSALVSMAAPAKDAAAKPAVTAPTLAEVAATQKQGRYLAVITMKSGKTIEMVLEGAYMPYTVTNYVKLAQAKFYDGLTFHRVEPDFVIQGGDPQGNGQGDPGYSINLEISPLLRHTEGALSMARTQVPDSAGCQFFITFRPTPFLDGGYAVFGWVKSGMDVVKTVKVGDVMQSVTVKPYAGTEPCPLLDPKIKAK